MEKRLYITTNLVNGKVYAGKHLWKENTKYMGSGYALKKAFIKYGKENFKIRWLKLKIETSEDLDRLEIRLIRLLKYRYGKNCYNIQRGGCGGYFTYYMTDEQKREVFDKISESKKKQWESGPTESQKIGRIKASETLKNEFKNNKELYERVFVEGNKRRISSLKNRLTINGKSQKEIIRDEDLVKYSLVYVSYKIVFPDGNEIFEINTLKDFQKLYTTQDNVFSHIKKHGSLTFLQKKNVSKHKFPTGTILYYISEMRGDEYEKTTGSSVPVV